MTNRETDVAEQKPKPPETDAVAELKDDLTRARRRIAALEQCEFADRSQIHLLGEQVKARDAKIDELEKQLRTLRAGVSGLTDERDLARAHMNTAKAKLADLQRQMGRASQPTVGSSDMEGLGNLEQAIALCSAGNAR